MFENTGKVAHDAFVGEEAVQLGHENQMQDMNGWSGINHSGDAGITVDAGKTATLSYRFATVGTTLIGCHQSGHHAAGIRIEVHLS